MFSAAAVLYGNVSLPIDKELSETSTNAIQNKIVYNEINTVRKDIDDIVNGNVSINIPTIDITDIDEIFK